jgi:hypothetical protein
VCDATKGQGPRVGGLGSRRLHITVEMTRRGKGKGPAVFEASVPGARVRGCVGVIRYDKFNSC